MLFMESEITSSGVKQVISQLHTKKQLNYSVTCIRYSNAPEADVILTSLNLMFKHSHKKREDSLKSSLDQALFAAKFDFLKILVPRLP